MQDRFESGLYWSGWQKASCLPDCWCEAARVHQMIVEPSNTVSNIFYIIAGLMVLSLIRHRKSIGIENRYSVFYYSLFSFALIFLGFGSGFFHMSLTYVGQWFDLLGMYLVTLFYILFLLQKRLNFGNKAFFASYFSINSLLGLLIYHYPEARRYIFVGFIAITLFCTFLYVFKTKLRDLVKWRFFNLSIASIILAQIAWNLDKFKVLCDPTYWLTGHAVWHLLAAASSYFFFLFLLSIPKQKVS